VLPVELSPRVLRAGRPRDGSVGLLHPSRAGASSRPPPTVPEACLRPRSRPRGPVAARPADLVEL